MKRLILAFIVAPLAPALPFFIFGLIAFLTHPNLQNLAIFFVVWAMIGIVAYPAAWMLGIPLYLRLRHRKKYQRLRYYVMIGSGIGLVQFLSLNLLSTVNARAESLGTHSFMAIFFMLCGACSALVFWLMTASLRKAILNSTTASV